MSPMERVFHFFLWINEWVQMIVYANSMSQIASIELILFWTQNISLTLSIRNPNTVNMA